jgi:hypothetical protein
VVGEAGATSELELDGNGRAGDDGAGVEPKQSGPDAERPVPSVEAKSEQPRVWRRRSQSRRRSSQGQRRKQSDWRRSGREAAVIKPGGVGYF